MPRLKQFDKQEILEKAMQLFWARGFNATSIQNLVEHLGINRASLYNTFGNKEELFRQAFDLYRDANKKRLTEYFASQPSIKDAFRSLFLQTVERAQNAKNYKGCFVVKSTTELMPDELEMSSIIEENKGEFEEIFREYLRTGIQTGEISKNTSVSDLASYLYTFYGGLEIMAVAKPDSDNFDEIIDFAIGAIR